MRCPTRSSERPDFGRMTGCDPRSWLSGGAGAPVDQTHQTPDLGGPQEELRASCPRAVPASCSHHTLAQVHKQRESRPTCGRECGRSSRAPPPPLPGAMVCIDTSPQPAAVAVATLEAARGAWAACGPSGYVLHESAVAAQLPAIASQVPGAADSPRRAEVAREVDRDDRGVGPCTGAPPGYLSIERVETGVQEEAEAEA